MTEQEQLEQSENGGAEPVRHWGVKLRQVREASGIPLRDIATELHLDIAMLEALEDEALDRLPGPSFVKGYLRSYARLLDLPADDLVQAYDCAHGDETPCLQRIGKVQQISSRDAGPRYATWGVVVVVGLSVLIWWSSKILSNGVSERDDDSSVTLAAPLSEKRDSAAIEADLEVDGESVSVAPLLVPEVEAPPPSAPEEAKRDSAPPSGAVQKMQPPLADESPAPVAAPSAPAEEGVELSQLTLIFDEDSWVEINDAGGKRLFFDLGRKGQVRELAGVKPFKILFGNAPGVTLKVDGKVFDHAAFQRRNGSAKFRLGD